MAIYYKKQRQTVLAAKGESHLTLRRGIPNDSHRMVSALGVWSRDEVARVNFENLRAFRPCMSDRLEGRPPLQRFEVPGKIIGRHESQDVGSQGVETWIMEGSNCRVFDCSIHPLCLAIGPRMIGLGEPVLDAMFGADTAEDVSAGRAVHLAVAIFGQVGEGHAVVREHSVNGVRKGADNAAQELGAVHLPGIVAELDVGELRDAIYREEHIEFSATETEFADINVDVSDLGLRESALSDGHVHGLRQTGNAMAQQTAMQARPGKVRDTVAQTAQNIVERQQCATAEFDDHRFFHRGKDSAGRSPRPHGSIGCVRAGTPLGHCGSAQAVALGQGTARLFRRLELGSNSRRCSG